MIFYKITGINYKKYEWAIPQKTCFRPVSDSFTCHLPYVRKNEKNSLEEDWLFQAILECYIPLLKSIESSKNENPLNTKLTISLSQHYYHYFVIKKFKKLSQTGLKQEMIS